MRCVYCGRDASEPHVHHIIPEAAGNSKRLRQREVLGELVLPHGLACIGCNRYFGHALDPSLSQHPYILQRRAVYRIASRRGTSPVYNASDVRIEATREGLLLTAGSGTAINAKGLLEVRRPSLEGVEDIVVSRAVHRAAFEYELIRIAVARDIEAARDAAGRPPLARIARYVRGDHRDYRPYGIEANGATGVNLIPFDFTVDPWSPLISPPAFTGYIAVLPGARFSCTLSDDVRMLQFMLDRFEETDARAYVTTRRIFWTPRSGGIVVHR